MDLLPDQPRRTRERRPDDDEIDVYGVTHPGKVRAVNQDHFLTCSLNRNVVVHRTSLPDVTPIVSRDGILAFLAMVADGVGGGVKGDEASRRVVEGITQYVVKALHTYYISDATADSAFARELEDAALTCHANFLKHAEEDPSSRGMATTLTLWIGVWPYAYLLQVGDSRCYMLRNGELTQITRDQTMAQDLIDAGVLSREDAANTRWQNVLSSAIGGTASAPVVTRMEYGWDTVGLICSDGLTKHVPDARIREILLAMTSAQQACEALLEEALDGGGSDNITIIVGRIVKKDGDGE